MQATPKLHLQNHSIPHLSWWMFQIMYDTPIVSLSFNFLFHFVESSIDGKTI